MKTAELIAKLNAIDPTGLLRVVCDEWEIVGADGQDAIDLPEPELRWARLRRYTFYPTGETRIDPDDWVFCSRECDGAEAVVYFG